MSHPAAWIPSRRASQDLMQIYHALNLSLNNEPVVKLIDGTRQLSASSASQSAFPCSYNVTTQEASLPPLIIDFFEWFYLPSGPVGGGPTTTQDKRLRLVIEANYNFDDAYTSEPAKCTLGTPAFEWVDATVGAPATSATVSPGSPFDYYFYLLRVNEGIISERATSLLFTRWPGV